MTRSRFAQAPIVDVRPIGEMNTTPLIDVLLVLLIMFIITIPVSTHKVAVDLPVVGKRGSVSPVHRLSLDRTGRATLDGNAIEIGRRLAAIASTPEAVLRFDADPATRYDAVDRMLAQVKRAGVTRMGFADLNPAF